MAEVGTQGALERLESGNARFRERVRENEPRRAELAAGQRPYAVVLLDAVMGPGLDGIEAGHRIRDLDRDVQLVVLTGPRRR